MKRKNTDNNELAPLFGDAQLQPSAQFERSLARRLHVGAAAPRGWWHSRRIVAGLIAAAVVVVGVMTLALIQPPAAKRVAQGTPLRALYASALAAELPDNGTTLWDLTEVTKYGPQGQLCTNYQNVPEYKPSRNIYFKKDNVTAWYSLGGYPNAYPLMRYSEDPQVPAFDDDVFAGGQSSEVRIMLSKTTPTDAEGKPIMEDAIAKPNENGIVDMYAAIENAGNAKEAVPGCTSLKIHIAIDTKSGLVKQIDVYNKQIGDENLSFSIQRTVFTGAPDFNGALPRLTEAGFNLETAKSSAAQVYTQVTNKPAGYELDYLRMVLGEPFLREEKDAAGKTVAYNYTFSQQPSVRVGIRTAGSTAGPRNVEELRAEAKAKGWNVIFDTRGDDSNVPGCKKGDYELNFVADDGTTKYVMTETTCGNFPVVYTTYPLAVELKRYDPIIKQSFPVGPIGGLNKFAPGGEPARMH